jgi:hypothetical protein
MMTGLAAAEDNKVSDARSSHRGRARQVRAVVAAVLLLPSTTGCYASVPVWDRTPAPNSEVTVGLSDHGRSVLAPQLGPGARRITGRLARTTDSAFVVRVTSVEYISNSSTGTWTGEEVSVSRDLVSGVTERHFSRGRSWLAAGVVVAALALATTIAINGFGNDPGGTKVPDGGNTQ